MILAIVAYVVTLAVAGGLTPGYRQSQQLISELGQLGAPHAALVRGMLIGVGVIVISFATALHRSIGGGAGSLLGPGLVGAVGMALLLGGTFQCDPTCAPVSSAGWTHVVTGGLASLGALAAPFVFARRMRVDPDWTRYAGMSSFLGWISLAAFAAALVAFPACGIPGVGQRIATAVQLGWVGFLAVALIRVGRSRASRGAT